jgi:rubredoxin
MRDLFQIRSTAAIAPGSSYTFCPECELKNVYLGQMDGVSYMLCRSRQCSFIYEVESNDDRDKNAARRWWVRNDKYLSNPDPRATSHRPILLYPEDIAEKRSLR